MTKAVVDFSQSTRFMGPGFGASLFDRAKCCKDPGRAAAAMRLKGINYDVGTRFGAELSRVCWRRTEVQRELGVIRDQLMYAAYRPTKPGGRVA